MEFEFDPAKSQANKAKHGIDFDQAKELWQAEKYVEYDVFTHDEPRSVRIAPLAGTLWFCVFTMRSEKIRLISVRHVRPEEKESMSKTSISAAEFDRLVDENKKDVTEYLDLESVRRPGTKRINIDLPNAFLDELDKEAARRGITRGSLIKTWLYDRLHPVSLATPIDLRSGRSSTRAKLETEILKVLGLAPKADKRVAEILKQSGKPTKSARRASRKAA